MPKVAKGLGIHVDFTVLPTYTLMAISRPNKPGSHTTFFSTSSGLDMYKLQLLDELVLKIASYALPDPPKSSKLTAKMLYERLQRFFTRWNGRIGLETNENLVGNVNPNRGPIENNLRTPTPDTTASLAERPLMHRHESGRPLSVRILDLASHGPGFFPVFQNRHHLVHPFSHLHTQPSASVTRINNTASVEPSGSVLTDAHTQTSPVAAITTASGPLNQKYMHTFSVIALRDATTNLRSIRNFKPLYNIKALCLVNGFASAGCAGLFFRGSWADILLSFIFGTVVFALPVIFPSTQFSRIYEFLSAFMVSLLTRVVSRYIYKVCYKPVVISSVIWLLQGITITLAVIELLTRKLVAGTVRLFYGIVIR